MNRIGFGMRRRDSGGFTLLELLLTMAVFAAGAALVLPIAGGLLSDRKLVRGGDQVRAELIRLRVHAMRLGKVMAVQADAGGKSLRVIPVFSASDAVESLDQTGSQSSLLSGADQTMGVMTDSGSQSGWEIELPEGIVVLSIVTSPVGGAASVEAAALNSTGGMGGVNSGASNGNSGAVTGSSPAIYFYPTGQTSNAILSLGRGDVDNGVGGKAGSADSSSGSGGDAVRIEVRGLTGDVTIRGGGIAGDGS